jgi:hypothetical protein
MPFAFALWLALLFGGLEPWDNSAVISAQDGVSGIPPRAADGVSGIPPRAMDGVSGIPRQ